MRARVLVGETRRRSTGATRSGLIENSSPVTPSSGRSSRPAAVRAGGRDRCDAVAVDGGRGGDRAGDDLALHQQALHARVDQAGAELRQIENADDERDQARDVEEDDAAREAREALADEELPGAPQRRRASRSRHRPARRGPAAPANGLRRDARGSPARRARRLRLVGRCRSVGLRVASGGSIEQLGSLPSSSAPRRAVFIAHLAGRCSTGTLDDGRSEVPQSSLKR